MSEDPATEARRELASRLWGPGTSRDQQAAVANPGGPNRAVTNGRITPAPGPPPSSLARLLAAALAAGCTEPPSVRLWSDPVPHDSVDLLFSTERINRIDITVDHDAADLLAAQRLHTDPRDEVPAEVTIDGELLSDTGVRLRGRYGSFQPFSRNPKWMLDFNEYVEDRRFLGLKGLALNNADEDCTFLREAMALYAFQAAGVPAPRVGFAQVFVQGEDKGLYVVVEPEDDRLLSDRFGDDDGALYDGGYVLNGAFPLFLDFGEGLDDRFELEEGADPHGRLARLSRSVQLAQSLGALTTLKEEVDWEEVGRHVAIEAWAAHTDGYTIGRNNVRYWFPAEGPMQILPWDLDLAFCDPNFERYLCDTDLSLWERPRGNLVHACLSDLLCHRQLAETAAQVADILDNSPLLEHFDALAALTEDGVRSAPWSRCVADEREARRSALRGWLEQGGDRLRGLWR